MSFLSPLTLLSKNISSSHNIYAFLVLLTDLVPVPLPLFAFALLLLALLVAMAGLAVTGLAVTGEWDEGEWLVGEWDVGDRLEGLCVLGWFVCWVVGE